MGSKQKDEGRKTGGSASTEKNEVLHDFFVATLNGRLLPIQETKEN